MYFTSTLPKSFTNEEQVEWFRKLETGDISAKNHLIEGNMRLVLHIVKKYTVAENPDDLTSIGLIGLIKAVNTYSLDKKVKFATYATVCIENEIKMALRRINKHSQTDLLEGIVLHEDSTGEKLTAMDVICDLEDPYQSVIANEEVSDMRKALNKLPDKEKVIIEMRYGLTGKDPLSQRDLCKVLGLSQSYISRIEIRAIKKIRLMMKVS